jgi:hypothetical protein
MNGMERSGDVFPGFALGYAATMVIVQKINLDKRLK